MTGTLNAFQAVRPRGNTPTPRTASGIHHGQRGAVPRGLVMDTNGRRCVPLGPRANGDFLIESGNAAQASADKRRALLKGGI